VDSHCHQCGSRSELSSVRIKIILSADQYYLLCTQQTKGKCEDDFFLFVSVWMKKTDCSCNLIIKSGQKETE
jgi:hypothetical protein